MCIGIIRTYISVYMCVCVWELWIHVSRYHIWMAEKQRTYVHKKYTVHSLLCLSALSNRNVWREISTEHSAFRMQQRTTRDHTFNRKPQTLMCLLCWTMSLQNWHIHTCTVHTVSRNMLLMNRGSAWAPPDILWSTHYQSSGPDHEIRMIWP